jgi:hypothetical protein
MTREELTALRDAIAMTLALPDSITAEEKPERLDLQPAAAHARWVRPIGDFERKETTIVEGLRYG